MNYPKSWVPQVISAAEYVARAEEAKKITPTRTTMQSAIVALNDLMMTLPHGTAEEITEAWFARESVRRGVDVAHTRVDLFCSVDTAQEFDQSYVNAIMAQHQAGVLPERESRLLEVLGQGGVAVVFIGERVPFDPAGGAPYLLACERLMDNIVEAHSLYTVRRFRTSWTPEQINLCTRVIDDLWQMSTVYAATDGLGDFVARLRTFVKAKAGGSFEFLRPSIQRAVMYTMFLKLHGATDAEADIIEMWHHISASRVAALQYYQQVDAYVGSLRDEVESNPEISPEELFERAHNP